MLGLLAGLRTGELCALAWRNVDLHAGLLRFIGKGGKPAIVTMPAQLVDEFCGWRQIVAANGIESNGDPPVCARCASRTAQPVERAQSSCSPSA